MQFADGSTVGKSDWGNALADQRKNLIIVINRLLLAYDGNGDEVFSSAIDEESNQPNISQDAKLFLFGIRDRLRDKGADDAARYLKDLLRNAPNHQASKS